MMRMWLTALSTPGEIADEQSHVPDEVLSIRVYECTRASQRS